MPRPNYFHLAVASAALAFFAVGTAGGILLRSSPDAEVAPESTDPTTAPVGDATRMLVDGDLEVAVARVTQSKTATVHVPAKGTPPLRARKGEQLAKADLQLMVNSRSARPTLCGLPQKGKPPRIAGAILVDDSGAKYAPRQDSIKVSLSAPCTSQPPFLAASVSLVFDIPEVATAHTLLVFDPREAGDAKGLTRLRFTASPENQ